MLNFSYDIVAMGALSNICANDFPAMPSGEPEIVIPIGSKRIQIVLFESC